MKRNIVRILAFGLILGAVLTSSIPLVSASDTYRVDVSAGDHGRVDPDGSIEVPAATDVIIRMIPDIGYTVDTWFVNGGIYDSAGRGPDVDGKTLVYRINGIAADTSVYVTFKRLTYNITTTPRDDSASKGTIEPCSGYEPIIVNWGDSLYFTAHPAEGYEVDAWSVDGTVVQRNKSSYRLENIISDHSVVVTFKLNESLVMADMFGIENGMGNSGNYVLIPINITNTKNGPITGIIFNISYDKAVINLTEDSLQNGDLTSTWNKPDFDTANNQISIAFSGPGTEIPDGSSGSVIKLNSGIVGVPGSKSAMNVSVIQLKTLNSNVGTAPARNGTFIVYLKGDLNNNGISADAGDLVLMKRASIGEIQGDSRYDLNNNGQFADAGDLVLMKRASIGEIIL